MWRFSDWDNFNFQRGYDVISELAQFSWNNERIFCLAREIE